MINIRSRCQETSLTAQDLHSLLGKDNGLTDQGWKRLSKVDAAVERILADLHETEGANVAEAFCGKYAGRDLVKRDLELMADDCDYLISVMELREAQEKPVLVPSLMSLFAGVSGSDEKHVLASGTDQTISWEMSRVMPRTPQLTVPYARVPHVIREAVLARCRAVIRQAENAVRRDEGLPEIGKGWISETELFQLILDEFPDTPVVQHGRPDWLGAQHLDVYLPRYNIGIEYQGAQHLEPVDYFGGEKGFEQQQRRDARKKRLCDSHGCALIYVYQGFEAAQVVDQIREALKTTISRDNYGGT